MGRIEIEPRQGGIEELLENYGIDLSPPLETQVSFSDSHGTLSLESVLGSSPEALLERPLSLLRQAREKAVLKKKHGRARSRREESLVEKNYKRMERQLINEGPGRTLAFIACNPGVEVEWAQNGLRGKIESGKEPSPAECKWWNWVYRRRGELTFLEDPFNQRRIPLLWASFVMRARFKQREISADRFDHFLKEAVLLVDEAVDKGDTDLPDYLREVAKLI